MCKPRTFMTKILCAGLLALVLASSGCLRHTFDNPGYPMEPVPRYAEWHHHFILGILSLSPNINLQAICPSGVARVETHVGPVGWVISVVTVGFWIPTSVYVFCAAGGRYAVDLNTGKTVAEAPAETAAPAEAGKPAAEAGKPAAAPAAPAP